MTYNPAIPQSTDIPAASQPQLLGNFQQLNAQFAENHVAFTATGQNGFHTLLEFPGSQSAPNLAAPMSSVFPSGNPAQLFFQNNVSPSAIAQLTGLPVVGSGGVFGIKTPWGLTINFGSVAVNGSSSVTYAIPFTSTIYTTQVTSNNTDPTRTCSCQFGSPALQVLNIYNLSLYTVFFFVIGV